MYYVGAINRPGIEEPWKIGEFYGTSYFADPRGQIMTQGTRNTDSIVVADLDLDLIREVRNTWQFYRDRRPESYGAIIALRDYALKSRRWHRRSSHPRR